ncbi:MAG: RNA polymerase subunit sigma [Planctomyces sp.]|nr:RNA polymerase subunit sigma [Planctomyces sp.]
MPIAIESTSDRAHPTTRSRGPLRGESSSVALIEAHYGTLVAIAERRLGSNRADAGYQAKDLLHEALIRLTACQARGWDNPRHFLASAGLAMRSVMIDRARAAGSLKRGGGQRTFSLVCDPQDAAGPGMATVEVRQSLEQLAALDERAARVVTLRFFAGYTESQIAHVLGITERTVRRDWVFARHWLRRVLGDGVLRGPEPAWYDHDAF